ncbi:hypothetical protein JX265_001038 [Neoarthrinium moseri]|uniref:Uncharacterized protein n=1 Tax=Neoarthrinium moseri TaxID=1658444 RepID=A0A9P9WWX9_9PEZI|nr:hypothetical protein JX265_001038 [Neoarthrinium moseri]
MSFTNAVVVSAEMIRLLPVWLKPYAVQLTPCWRKRKLTEDLMKDEVLQRLQLSHKVKGKPNDLLQWIVDASPVKERTVKNIVERILGLNVAAIHTTTSVRLYIRSSMSLTDSAVQSLVSALALLAADSERYIPPMREEIAMNSEKGHITPRTMAGATKLDSFLRESGRVNLNSMIGLMRTARRDFHFKDGTLIPAGTRIGVPTISIHHDSTLYSEPQNVDCFRFVGASGGLADTNRFHPARTGLDYLTFGHGKNACPGRFFAVNLMKLVLAEMIHVTASVNIPLPIILGIKSHSSSMAELTAPAPLLAEAFANHALNTRFEDLTPDAVAQAKVFILDTFGVGIAGSSAFGAEAVIQAGASWGNGNEASLWGRRQRVPATLAALVNGYQVHCQEYDCVHEGAVLHPLATTLPAVIALAERAGGISGKDLITAVAVGVNISAGLGIASKSAMRFFRPATAGGFGATAAVGRLLGLSHESLVQAFGLQYAQTSGTLQPHVEGSAALPLQVGLNSRAALQSCDWVSAGLPGPRDVFEGPYGYLPLFEGPDRWDLSGTYDCLAGRRWLVSELSHKPYPAGRATHGGVEGLQVLMKKTDGSTLKPDDIKSVTITGPPVTARLCARPDLPDPTPNYARLCMSYIAAKVLLNGFVDLAHYRGKELTDPATHNLAKRIKMLSDGQADPNALVPISVELCSVDGEIKTWRCDQMLASPSRRLTREQHLAKFRRCWEFAAEPLPEASREALIKLVDDLENVDNIKRLTTLLSPPSQPGYRSSKL